MFIEFVDRGIVIGGFTVYYYGMIIAAGMCAAILVCAWLLKRKGLPYDAVFDYAVFAIPLGVLGARVYYFLFPDPLKVSWAQFASNWTFNNFFAIRDGGLGIYGGVIIGYLVVWTITRIKKQNFLEVVDTMMPGVLLAQSLGRWGNFINGEAHGNLITNPALQWFPYGVEVGGSWYQATFFYESMATLLGFVICLLLLRNKHYRDGWCLLFYGIYYGTVRLIIEGFRTDSLYLAIPDFANKTLINTGIRISQAVSVIAIVLAAVRLIIMYRKEIASLFTKRRKNIG